MWDACTGMTMAGMVEEGVREGDPAAVIIPKGHGVEAQLAHAHHLSAGTAQQLNNAEAHGSMGHGASHQGHLPANADPTAADAAANLPGHIMHPTQSLAGGVSDDTGSGVHQHDVAGVQQTGQAAQHPVAFADDAAITDKQGAQEGLMQSNLLDPADNTDTSSGEEQRKLKSKVSESTGSTAGIVGRHAVAQHQTVDSGAALSQLFSFGIPFAGIFAVAAVMLWRQLGDLRPLTSQSGV